MDKRLGRKIFEPQEVYHCDMRRQWLRQVGRFFLTIFVGVVGLFGLTPVYGSIFVDWLSQPRFIGSWPLCVSGIVVALFSLLTLCARRKKWPGIWLTIATGTELILWTKVFLTQYQFKILGAAVICGWILIIMAVILVFSLTCRKKEKEWELCKRQKVEERKMATLWR